MHLKYLQQGCPNAPPWSRKFGGSPETYIIYLFITRKPMPFYPWLLIASISWGYREQQQAGVDGNAKTDPRSDSEEWRIIWDQQNNSQTWHPQHWEQEGKKEGEWNTISKLSLLISLEPHWFTWKEDMVPPISWKGAPGNIQTQWSTKVSLREVFISKKICILLFTVWSNKSCLSVLCPEPCYFRRICIWSLTEFCIFIWPSKNWDQYLLSILLFQV